MVDGAVARKTNTVSKFGSKFDTIADFLFVTAVLIKLFPLLDIDMWIAIWIAFIALIKLTTIAYTCISKKQFVTVHSDINKVTGAILFVLPLTFSFIDLRISATLHALLRQQRQYMKGTT